ncbi:MAG: hypothetical protein JXR73_11585 [Candidatus Omnitrophica bacterium]|nr:hypothetical protein [Candidatus Omnitrophota bacterium]
MLRPFLCLYIGLTVLAGVFSSCAFPQTEPSVEKILQSYRTLSEQAHRWSGRLEMRSQRMLIDAVRSEWKKTFEQMYGLSPLNSVYREHEQLFFKSHAALDWDVHIQNNRSNGKITILNSTTNLSAAPPVLTMPDASIVSRLSSSSPSDLVFGLNVDASQVETNLSPFILPMLLVDWHYPPWLWYPPLDKIGFPADASSIRARLKNDHSLALVYTPDRLDNHLLTYLRILSGDAQLDCSGLTNILLLEVPTGACLSFSITIQSEEKQRSLFSIANSEPSPISTSPPFPSLTTIMTCWRIKEGDRIQWDANYFCQYHLKNVTDH